MKLNDIVRLKPGNYFYDKLGDRFTGRVIKVIEGTSDEDHGAINIILTKVDSYYLDVGEIEHFVHYGWEKYLEIVNDA